jgi:hypothetical protein
MHFPRPLEIPKEPELVRLSKPNAGKNKGQFFTCRGFYNFYFYFDDFRSKK